MKNSPLAVARACLQAYVDKDRTAIEKLIAADHHFTSQTNKPAFWRARLLQVLET